MEYTNTVEPFIYLIISFILGLILGAFWMFCVMLRTQRNLEKELDSKNRLLDIYEKTYEDDGYEDS
jgi:uncharacterized membrane-anchored protein YhcB (DUF1043 family)